MDLIAKAEHELTELSRQIAALQQRQDSLKSFIAIGRTLVDGEEQKAPLEPQSDGGHRKFSEPVQLSKDTFDRVFDRPPSIKQQVLVLAEQAISNAGPQNSRAHVEHVESHGVSIGGAHKVLAISTILSRAKDKFK